MLSMTVQDPTYAAPVSPQLELDPHETEPISDRHVLLVTDGLPQEVRSGQRYGPLVDMYALGCILYQCCTLR
jgi:serine/threonine protein kinase